jgi:uncharacterized membrane protein YdbT with pleckstrin-like domain
MIKLQPDEKIIATIKRHWIVVVSEIAFLAALALIPVILVPYLFSYQVLESNPSNFAIAVFIWAFWWYMLWVGYFVFWTNYHLDAWVITNQKIIDIEQHGLFNREVSEYRLERIQDVTIRVNGLVATWLKFGDIDVQTAGESSSHFVIRHAPNPEHVKDLIIEQQNLAVNLASSYKPIPKDNI